MKNQYVLYTRYKPCVAFSNIFLRLIGEIDPVEHSTSQRFDVDGSPPATRREIGESCVHESGEEKEESDKSRVWKR